jgi:hypothetical protein
MAQPDTPSRDTTARPRSLLDRSAFWWAVTAAVLLLGYADLARGGVTLAPILLIIGYCVLVPLAILR